MSNEEKEQIPLDVDGIWVDNAGINEYSYNQDYPEKVQQIINDSGWNGLYFGGVAFKYQRPVFDLENACQIAENYMDVVTTSGSGTGSPPEIEKINRMGETISKRKIAKFAIASGITPENVHLYYQADCLLVATGISENFYTLHPTRVKLLSDNLVKMRNNI